MKPFGWPVVMVNTREESMASQDARTIRAHGAQHRGHARGRVRQFRVRCTERSHVSEGPRLVFANRDRRSVQRRQSREGESASPQSEPRPKAAADPDKPSIPRALLAGVDGQRKQAVDAFNSESDARKCLALWAYVHRAICDETPTIKIGDFNVLAARSPKLGGVVPALWPYFWNASIKP